MLKHQEMVCSFCTCVISNEKTVYERARKPGKNVFCNRDCWRNHKKQLGESTRVNKNCAACGKAFSVWPSVLKRQNRNTCSRACAKALRPRIIKKCERCGKEFSTYYCLRYESKYCSTVCKKNKLTIVNKKCLFCKKDFATNQERQMYCSVDCANKNKMTDEVRAHCSEGRMRWWESLSKEQQKEAVHRIRGESRMHKINKLEASILAELPECVKFTGDLSFYVDLELDSNRFKNPDFIVTPFETTHRVIEIFGNYWHTQTEAHDLIAAYRNVGVECVVVWEHDYKKCPDEVVRLLTLFAATGKVESMPNIGKPFQQRTVHPTALAREARFKARSTHSSVLVTTS